MSSSSHPIIITSDSDIEDASSSTTVPVPLVSPAPAQPSQETLSLFEEDETAYTPLSRYHQLYLPLLSHHHRFLHAVLGVIQLYDLIRYHLDTHTGYRLLDHL